MFSIWSVAFVEVPPMKPKNNSFVVPAHADTSINRLAETVFVGTYFASNENRLFVPMPHTSTSSTGLPATVKSNANATASPGICTGSQAIGGELESPPPSPAPLAITGPPRSAFGLGDDAGWVRNVSRSTAES